MNNRCTLLQRKVEELEALTKNLDSRSPLSSPPSSGNGTETETDYEETDFEYTHPESETPTDIDSSSEDDLNSPL